MRADRANYTRFYTGKSKRYNPKNPGIKTPGMGKYVAIVFILGVVAGTLSSAWFYWLVN